MQLKRPYPKRLYPSEPGICEFIEKTNQFYPPDAIDFTIAQQRQWYDAYCAAFRQARPASVQVFDTALEQTDYSIPLRYYQPEHQAAVRVIYYHGGGFVVGGLGSHDDICAELCERTGCEVISVAYRLCPEHPHPAAFEDALAVFEALRDEGLAIILAGDSAGGNLVAAVCLAARDRGGPQAVGQLLIYPGLGGDHSRGSFIEQAEAPLLSTRDIEYYWRIRAGGAEPPLDDPSFAPLAAQSFFDLPPAAIFSAHFDPLRDDSAEYAARLQAAGVPVIYRDEPEMVHAYLRARIMSPGAKASFTAICQAVLQLSQQ